MRDLTDEELALAPDWATHYIAFDNGEILFESNTKYCLYDSIQKKFHGIVGCLNVSGESVPINRKPFDITQHKWSDEAKDCHIYFYNPSWVGKGLQVVIPDVNGNENDAVLIREHAIAIARHFKLKAEDLC